MPLIVNDPIHGQPAECVPFGRWGYRCGICRVGVIRTPALGVACPKCGAKISGLPSPEEVSSHVTEDWRTVESDGRGR